MRSAPRVASRGGPFATDTPASAADQVKAAIAAASSGPAIPRNRGNLFSFDTLSPREAFVAPFLGIYLGFSVARIHERFPVLAVPYLLWGMMAVMLLTIMASLPRNGWRMTWENSPQLRLVAVLAGLAIFTVPFGVWMQGALDFLINKFTIVIAVYLACIILLRDSRSLRRVVALYVAIATVVAVANLISYFNHDLSTTALTAAEALSYQQGGEVDPDKLRQTFGSLDPNDLAAVMAVTLPMALWLAAGSFRRRLFWTPSALVMVIAVIPTASRGGLLGLAAAAITLVLVGSSGGKRILLAGTLAVGTIGFIALAGAQMDRLSNFSGTDYNYTAGEGRIEIWKRGIVWMTRRPWGYGLENFPVYFGWLNGADRAAHNSLIQYGVELGVLGLAAYLTICVTLVKSLLKIRRIALAGGPKGQDTVTLCGHVLAMLAACWTTGFFLSNAYYPLTYMAIGIASAVVLSKVGTAETIPTDPIAEPAPAMGRLRRRQLKAFQAA